MVVILGVLDSVTPKVWHDEPLLRILTGRRMRLILSLRHPCPDRAMISFIGKWRFWEEWGFCILFVIMVKCFTIKCINQWVNRILREAKYFRISGRWKGILDETITSSCPTYTKGGMGGGAFNGIRSPKESTNPNTPVPLPYLVKINRRIKAVPWIEAIKSAPWISKR